LPSTAAGCFARRAPCLLGILVAILHVFKSCRCCWCQSPWKSLSHVCAGPEEGIVTMALGSSIPASLYTLPRLWDQLKTEAQYAKRLAQINEFNKSSVWLKRGISITPCRCTCACCPSCYAIICSVQVRGRFCNAQSCAFPLRREWSAPADLQNRCKLAVLPKQD